MLKNFRCRAVWHVGALMVAVVAGLVTSGRAAEPALPLVTPKNVEQFADKPATVEVTVVEVKFAERRQLHFLSATANFRSLENIPVAIRAADLGRFQKAGITDLSVTYLKRKIRARGTVTRDDEQWIVVVTSPDEIEVRDVTAEAAAPAQLVIVNEQGKQTTLTVPLAKGLMRTKVTVEHEGQQETYEGVLLSTLLERAGVTLGAEARGRMLGRYALVTAKDGYAAVFSLAELDPFYVEKPAILADTLVGGGLPANRAPLQVAVPGDTHRRRWVGQVIRIEVHNALDAPGGER